MKSWDRQFNLKKKQFYVRFALITAPSLSSPDVEIVSQPLPSVGIFGSVDSLATSPLPWTMGKCRLVCPADFPGDLAAGGLGVEGKYSQLLYQGYKPKIVILYFNNIWSPKA